MTFSTRAVEAAAREMWHTFSETPESGRKFIAIYSDGSGAAMFFAFEDGVIDSDGDEYYGWNPDDAQYDLWAYLPDTVQFWCEVRSEDPITLAAASDGEERK